MIKLLTKHINVYKYLRQVFPEIELVKFVSHIKKDDIIFICDYPLDLLPSFAHTVYVLPVELVKKIIKDKDSNFSFPSTFNLNALTFEVLTLKKQEVSAFDIKRFIKFSKEAKEKSYRLYETK